MFDNNAPQTFVKEVFNSESKTVTTSTQQFDAKKVNVYGHIIALIFAFQTTITKGSGTINTSKTVLDAFGQITIRDKNSRPILDDDSSRFPIIRKILSFASQPSWADHKRGEYDAGTALTDTGSAQTHEMEIPIDINLRDQPISVEYVVDTLSDLLSTVGTATATAQLQIASINIVPIGRNAQYAQRETRRLYSYVHTSAISSETELQNGLPTGVVIDNVACYVTTDSNVTDYTLKPTGKSIGIDRLARKYIEQMENRNAFDGHTSGYHVLNHAPFKVGDSTLFSINPASSFTPRIFLTHRGVR
ncbi:hypothetical protein [Nitrosopumilus spindle-shaped virus]|uniref:Uncharacterized protein n=1 Tax=Nitrosopumilus spindle-shaped virus TaxID=2508184 RepID=A0A514K343_9VIRU|nr:hypothetical protein [Nitrosopumilus spindle-shaped virus]